MSWAAIDFPEPCEPVINRWPFKVSREINAGLVVLAILPRLRVELVFLLGIFERLTKIHPKDCLISEDSVYFLIDGDKIGFAIGKNGSTVKKISKTLNPAGKKEMFTLKKEERNYWKKMQLPTRKRDLSKVMNKKRK